MGTISSNLKQKLRTCFENSSPQGNIKAIPNSTNVIFSFLRLKDIFCKELQSQKNINFLTITTMLFAMTKLSTTLT